MYPSTLRSSCSNGKWLLKDRWFFLRVIRVEPSNPGSIQSLRARGPLRHDSSMLRSWLFIPLFELNNLHFFPPVWLKLMGTMLCSTSHCPACVCSLMLNELIGLVTEVICFPADHKLWSKTSITRRANAISIQQPYHLHPSMTAVQM